MLIEQWLTQEFGDIDIPAYYMLQQMKQDVYDFRQMNEKTQVNIISDHALRFEDYTDIKWTRFHKPQYTPIIGWNWQGLKALGWRLWKAFFANAPTEKGYKITYETVEGWEWNTKDYELKPYQWILHGTRMRFYAVYDGYRDILFVNENIWREPYDPFQYRGMK